jgi:hypothetical protein
MYIVISDCRSFQMYHTLNLSGYTANGSGSIMTIGVLELEGGKPEIIKTWVNANRENGVY